MITIADVLQPKHIDLNVKPGTQEEIVYHVAMLLRSDEHVKDWQAFYGGLKAKDSFVLQTDDVKICIPHTRTSGVTTMVMAVGRSLIEESAPKKKNHPVIQYTFVIGVPGALASDYLRIIGALARMFKDKPTEAKLRAAERREEFLDILTQKEMAG